MAAAGERGAQDADKPGTRAPQLQLAGCETAIGMKDASVCLGGRSFPQTFGPRHKERERERERERFITNGNEGEKEKMRGL